MQQLRGLGAIAIVSTMLVGANNPPCQAQQKAELVLPTVHWAGISDMVLGPDGKTFATAGTDWTVKTWDTRTAKQLKTFPGGEFEPLYGARYSLDGKLLASNTTSTVPIWDVATGKSVRVIDLGDRIISSIAFFPAGPLPVVAVALEDGGIDFYDATSGKKTRSIKLDGTPRSMAFSSDGKNLVVGGKLNASLWNAATGQKVRTFSDGLVMPTKCVRLSPDDKTLACGTDEGKISLFKVDSAAKLRTLSGHDNWIFALGFSQDGKTLASASRDDSIKLWDVSSGKELRTLKESAPLAVMFTPDGKKLYSTGSEASIKIWDPATGNKLQTLAKRSSPVGTVVFAPGGKLLAIGTGGSVKLWDLASGKQTASIDAHDLAVSSIAFSKDGKYLVTATEQGVVAKLWDLPARKELTQLNQNDDELSMVNTYGTAFTPDGKQFVCATASGVTVWDVASRKRVKTYPHDGTLWSLSLSPDGKSAATGSDDSLFIWNIATGKKDAIPSGGQRVVSLAYSADGKTLLSGTTDGAVTLWEVASKKKLRSYAGHRDSATCVAFSPDGTRVAAGSDDKTVILWETATGKKLQTLSGHGNSVKTLAFAPGGKILASGGLDATVKLWSLPAGKEVASLCSCDKSDWAVVAPQGNFDASPEAMKAMHWRLGDKCVELGQLKSSYAEPGLLPKVMSGGSPRTVPNLEQSVTSQK